MSEQPEKKKIKRLPRNGQSYRASRRNEAKRNKTKMIRLADDVREGDTPEVRLNRSENWPRAASYAYAREISKSKEPLR